MHLETYEFKITRKRHIPSITRQRSCSPQEVPELPRQRSIPTEIIITARLVPIKIFRSSPMIVGCFRFRCIMWGLSILFRCLLGGAAIIITNSTKNLAELITQFKITHVSVVPAQLYRLLKENPSNLPSLKSVLVGGAPHSGKFNTKIAAA